MPVRLVVLDVDGLLWGSAGLAEAASAVPADAAGGGAQLCLVADDAPPRPNGPGPLRLAAADLGRAVVDAHVLAVAAAAGGCRTSEVLVVTDRDGVLAAAAAVGCAVTRPAPGGGPVEVAEVVRALDDAERAQAADVGVGPHPEPWPDDPRLDPALLADGDRRNVEDRFRYWHEAAIVAELDRHRLPLHVAVENWQHDLNIGTVVRNANAFNVAGVHIIGKRRWNRRGAMATDRYLRVSHHADVASFVAWAQLEGLPVVGIDNVDGASPLEVGALPSPAVLAFGQEGPGLSHELVSACTEVRSITQLGSTRSLNAGVASGIAMHWWLQEHRPG